MSDRPPETAVARAFEALLGLPQFVAPSPARNIADPAALAAGIEPTRLNYAAQEFLGLPPAIFAARVHAALLGRPPAEQDFLDLRDRLLMGRISRTQVLEALQKSAAAEGRDVRLSGLSSAKFAGWAGASLPVQAALALARLVRNLRRLPKNLRNARKLGRIADTPGIVARAPTLANAKPRVAIVAVTSGKGERGGAERFHAGLHAALNEAGIAAELVPLESREESFNAVRQSYRRFLDLDLAAYDGVISSKAPSYAVRHPNHVCYLMHTMRGYYDMFGASHPYASREARRQRLWIQAADTAALQAPRRLLAIGEEVALRLRHFNGLDARVVHVPTSLAGLTGGPFRHLLIAGRLHPWKRVDLAIAAMRQVSAPIRLVIAGTGQEEAPLRALAKGDARIDFVGAVSDSALAALYADAMAVLFLPRGEDLGLVTLEAFAAGKPVITCCDSGEPARLVRDGVNGFVCAPEAHAIAACIETLIVDPARAAAFGAAGAASIASIGWDHVAAELGAALGFAPI